MASLRNEDEQSTQRKHQKSSGKQNSGGEPTKHAQLLHEDEEKDRQAKINVGEGHDRKKGNIGPSGQGSHRGRERSTHQSKASGGPIH